MTDYSSVNLYDRVLLIRNTAEETIISELDLAEADVLIQQLQDARAMAATELLPLSEIFR